MPRNNPKPTGKVNWDATGNIVEPNAGRKTSGWLFGVKPPAQNFNWLWNLLGLNQFYSNAQVEDWIVIDSDADEGDYATLVAYIADAPAAGDRILVKEDQTVTAQIVLPANITLKFLDGSNLLCATNIATSVLKLGSNPIIEGVLNIVLSQTGTTAKAVEIDGDNAIGNINVENSSTGTLTTAYHINANKTGNRVSGFAQNTGGGTLTNIIVDNSTENSNLLTIVDELNNIVISTALIDFASSQILSGKSFLDSTTNIIDSSDNTKKVQFQCASIATGTTRIWTFPNNNAIFVGEDLSQSLTNKELGVGTKIALGSDADGDIYYRDAGILKRLAKGTNEDTLKLKSGLPSWESEPLTKIIDIGDWDMSTATGSSSKDVAHGLTDSKIRGMNVMIRDDTAAKHISLEQGDTDGDPTPQGSIGVGAIYSGSSVRLTRLTSGRFDSTSYDSTSYNRGWLTITYIP